MTTPRNEINRRLHQMPSTRERMTPDLQRHRQIEWARRNQELLDLAEGIRFQVVSTLLSRAVGKSEATRLIREARSRPPAMPSPPDGWRR